MLREIPNIRQSDQRSVKRWFTSASMDLFVWFDSDLKNSIPLRFQLSYNKLRNERLLSWEQSHGVQFFVIDSGESFAHQYKGSPLMIGSAEHRDIAGIAYDFLAASKNIDSSLADFIHARLMEYRISRAMHDAARRGHPDVN